MVERKSIRSLAALRKEKKRLQAQMGHNRQALLDNTRSTRSDIQIYAFRRVLLPLGALATLIVLGIRLGKRRPNQTTLPENALAEPRTASEQTLGTKPNLLQHLRQWWPFIQAALTFGAAYFKQAPSNDPTD